MTLYYSINLTTVYKKRSDTDGVRPMKLFTQALMIKISVPDNVVDYIAIPIS